MDVPFDPPPIATRPSRQGLDFAIASVVFAAAVIAVMGEVLFGGGNRVLSDAYSDLYSQFYASTQAAFREIAKGRLPLWNPHLYCGTPWLGGFQQAMLYPPEWIHLLLPLGPAFNWTIALHVFLAGMFTYLWMRQKGLGLTASILAGMIFAFGGSYFLHITPGHLSNLRTMVWAPLIFLAIDDIAANRLYPGVWIGAGAAGMQILAGHPQYVYYTALFAGLYACLSLLSATSRPRAVLSLLLMVVGGAALSAIQLFAGLAAAGESMRDHLSIQQAHVFFFPPENLLTAIAPEFFGDVANGSYWGRWYLPETSLFMGTTAFLLAVYGAVRGERRFRRFAITMVVVSLVVAIGSTTPLYGLLYRALPGFGSFRGVSKCSFIATLFLANLAAVGMERLLGNDNAQCKAPRFAAWFALALAAIGAALWRSGDAGKNGFWSRHVVGAIRWNNEAYQGGIYSHGPIDPTFALTSAHAGALQFFSCAAAAAIVAALWFAATRYNRRWALGIAAAAVAELLAFASGHLPTFNAYDITLKEGMLAAVLPELPPDARVASDQPCFMLGAGGNEAWGSDPMALRRYIEFMTIHQSLTPDALARRGYPFFNMVSPTWGMIRLKAVWVAGSGLYGDSGMRPQMTAASQLPRALLLEDARVIEDREAMLTAIGDPAFDPSQTVLLEKPIDAMPAHVSSIHAGAPGTVTCTDLSTDAMDITADVPRPCVLLITDNYSSGWQARPFDWQSRPYEVVPADHTLRGIYLWPGHHHFVLEYRPGGYIAGKWITIVATALYLVAGFVLLIDTPRKKSNRITRGVIDLQQGMSFQQDARYSASAQMRGGSGSPKNSR